MLYRPLAAALLAVALFATPAVSKQHSETPAPISAGTLAEFDGEATAQAHCPADTVVWLNTKTGIWHEKGMRWYGNTREGAYVCRKEASAAGDRDTRNGQ